MGAVSMVGIPVQVIGTDKEKRYIDMARKRVFEELSELVEIDRPTVITLRCFKTEEPDYKHELQLKFAIDVMAAKMVDYVQPIFPADYLQVPKQLSLRKQFVQLIKEFWARYGGGK